jgi:hypothetical protein
MLICVAYQEGMVKKIRPATWRRHSFIGGDGAQARLHSMGIKIHCVHRTWGIMTKKPCTDGKLRSHYASGRVGKRSNDHATPPQRDSPVTTKVGLPARY